MITCFATDSFERSAKKRRTAALFDDWRSGNIPTVSSDKFKAKVNCQSKLENMGNHIDMQTHGDNGCR